MSSKTERRSSLSVPDVNVKKSKKKALSASADPDSPKKRRKLSTGSTQSCHQCRQSILSNKGISELKAGKARRQCDTCTTYWCENCLENRYGLNFVEISGKHWSCPKCQKTCNCSICRKRAGMLATGILTPLAKQAGFTSVTDFLSKGTGAIAECLQWKDKENDVLSSPEQTGKAEKRKRACSECASPTQDDGDASPSAKRAKKKNRLPVEGRSRRKSDFDIDFTPVAKPARRRTSLEEKRVTADEYRLRLKQQQEETARQKAEEKERKKAAKADVAPKTKQPNTGDGAKTKQLKAEDAAKAKQLKAENATEAKLLKKQALDEINAEKAAEREEDRRRCKELKQGALEEARKLKAEESEQRKETKRQEVEQLRSERMSEKQRKQEEHKQELEAIRLKKMAERERETEEKRKELSALREEKARARDEEREAKKQQLETLRAHVSQQKQAVKDLLSVGAAYPARPAGSKPNFSRTPSNVSSASASDSESGVDCDFLLPPIVPDETVPDICITIDLPELPAWEVPVPVVHYHNLLLVSEFLASFSTSLGLSPSQSYTAERLAQTLMSRTTIPSLQLALMRALLKAEKFDQDEESCDDGFGEESDVGRVHLDQLPKLTTSSCPCVLEQYLAMVAYKPDTTTVKGAGRRKLNADERAVADKCEKLAVVAFLCERLNGMRYIAELINETSEDLVELQRKHRVAEREVCKQINEELKVWTAEQLMARKDLKSTGEVTTFPSASERFSKQISEVRSKQQCEHDAQAAAVRGHLLGRDRNSRVYWHLRSVTGILIEEDSTSQDGEEAAPATGRRSRKTKEKNPFTICATSDHMDKLLDSLCMEHPSEAALSHQLKLRYSALCEEEAEDEARDEAC